MTQKEVMEIFSRQVGLCYKTLQQKTQEYAGDDPDRLGVFKTAAALMRCSPSQALAGMLAKHIVSLYDMCFADSESYRMDTWEEKITDSINYLFLLKAMVKEEYTHQPNRSEDTELPGH